MMIVQLLIVTTASGLTLIVVGFSTVTAAVPHVPPDWEALANVAPVGPASIDAKMSSPAGIPNSSSMLIVSVQFTCPLVTTPQLLLLFGSKWSAAAGPTKTAIAESAATAVKYFMPRRDMLRISLPLWSVRAGNAPAEPTLAQSMLLVKHTNTI